MAIIVKETPQAHVVLIQDAKLTYPILGPFFAEIRRLVDAGAHRLVLDMTAVTYLDSASIGCLMDIHRLVKEHSGVLRLCGLQPRVETMISMTGVLKIIEAFHDEAEALAALDVDHGEGG
jgi:anti-sigma B factor antagonist